MAQIYVPRAAPAGSRAPSPPRGPAHRGHAGARAGRRAGARAAGARRRGRGRPDDSQAPAPPPIGTARLADLRALRAVLTRVPPYDWIVFTSQNAVHVVCDRLPEWELAPRDVARAAVAAIGPATAKALDGPRAR